MLKFESVAAKPAKKIKMLLPQFPVFAVQAVFTPDGSSVVSHTLLFYETSRRNPRKYIFSKYIHLQKFRQEKNSAKYFAEIYKNLKNGLKTKEIFQKNRKNSLICRKSRFLKILPKKCLPKFFRRNIFRRNFCRLMYIFL